MTDTNEPPAERAKELRMEFPVKYDAEGQIIWTADRQRLLDIRGWGYLTGGGGLRLHPEDAAKIQDARGEYIVEAINNHEADSQRIRELQEEVERLKLAARDVVDEIRAVGSPSCGATEALERLLNQTEEADAGA